MNRRTFLGTAAAAVGLAQTKRPLNVVLILADDLGWADLACYGADLHETPHLDQLARDGARFTNALSAAPICSPTRASIMTGKHPARLGMTIWHEGAVDSVRGLPNNRKLLTAVAEPHLKLEEVTIGEVMQSAGYRTAMVGKWHLGTAEYGPETQGFEINIGGTHWGAPATFFYPYRGNKRFRGEFRYVPGLGFGKPGEYLTDRLTDEALKTIDRAGKDPFFVYLAHHSPHTPIEAPEALVAKYRAKLKPGMNHFNATYAAMVETFDNSVGRVRAHLKQRGLDRNTAIIVMSDNGGFINESEGSKVTSNAPLRSGKGSLYEGGIRVPLLIYWPGVTKPGTVIDEPVVSTDLFRTVAEMTGASGTSHPDGLSLVPLLRGAARRLPEREAFYFHYPHYYATTTPASAIRTRRWKLIEYYEDNKLELYDLESDPAESRDLASSQPAVVAELKKKLDAWKIDVAARLPKPNPKWVSPAK